MMIIVDIASSFVYHSFVTRVNFITEESMCFLLRNDRLKDSSFFSMNIRWFIIKDSYITYLRPDTYEIRFPMLVDRGFDIMTGFRHVKTPHGIKITNLQRTLLLKCRNSRECEEWTQHLLDLKEKAKGFVSGTVSRFSSFAPVRRKQLAYW